MEPAREEREEEREPKFDETDIGDLFAEGVEDGEEAELSLDRERTFARLRRHWVIVFWEGGERSQGRARLHVS